MAKQSTKTKLKRDPAPFAVPEWPALRAKAWPLGKIKPYAGNPRSHPEAQVALLADLMKRWGVDQPIVVDEDGVILKGHGRLLAAHRAGFKEFPVAQHVGLTDEEKTAIRIADNQAALLSGWDDELLAAEVRLLDGADVDLSILGFGEGRLEELLEGEQAPAEFKSFGENIETEHECPRCKYRWSGKAAVSGPVDGGDREGKEDRA